MWATFLTSNNRHHTLQLENGNKCIIFPQGWRKDAGFWIWDLSVLITCGRRFLNTYYVQGPWGILLCLVQLSSGAITFWLNARTQFYGQWSVRIIIPCIYVVFHFSKHFLLLRPSIMPMRLWVGSEGIHRWGKVSFRCKISIIWHLELQLVGWACGDCCGS